MKLLKRKQKRMLIFVVGALLFPMLSFAQKASITGTVKDKNNETVIGATAIIEGTTIGAVTDIDGKFTITGIEPGKRTLLVSMVGFKKYRQEVDLKAGQTFNVEITLQQDILELEQVVVVGYGIRAKRDVTGSIETIKAKELLETSVPSFDQAMQGRAAGVQVTAMNGVAGAPVKINIRGTSSISAGSEPLYVIDGIPMTSGDFSSGALGSGTNALADLNPNDIESIDVLKDAASAAIYGSRGSNGVIIITTKKGKAGKTKFNANYSAGVISETKRLKFITAKEHLALIDRYRQEVGLAPMQPTDNMGAYGFAELTRAQADSVAEAGGTDWISKALQQGFYQDATVSASGGNDKTIFYIGGTYHKEKGFLVGNAYERISGRINVENKASKILTLGANIGITFSGNDRVPLGDDGGLGNAQKLFPWVPIYKPDGSYFFETKGGYPSNVVWELENRKYRTDGFRTVSGVFADFTITQNLSYRSEFGLDFLSQEEDEFNKRSIQDPNSVSSAWNRRTDVINWTTNNFLTYNKTLDEIHDVQITFGNALQKSTTTGVGLHGWNFPNDFYTHPNAAEGQNQDGYYYKTGYGFVSNFIRINYKLKNRYIAAVSMRNDASSRFGKDNRYGWFPSGSAAWIITDEPWLKDNHTLSFLKLRASYGLTGNANIGDFEYLSVYYASSGYMGDPGIVPGNLPNPELHWEKAAQLDLTLDYGILDNRISGSATYYNKKTSDMLLNISLPTSSGYSSIRMNAGAMVNYGYEFALATKNLNGKFKWSTDFNIAFNRNEVTDVKGLPPDAFESGQPGEGRVIVGYPVGQSYVVQYAGVQKEDGTITTYDDKGNAIGTEFVPAGSPLYYDKFGNLMSQDNPYFYEHRVPMGKPIPDFVGGISNTLSYKGVELSFLFSFVYGNTIYDDPAKLQIGAFDKIAQRPEILDAWTKDNPDSDVPMLSLYEPRNSDRFLYDASFIRLRSVNLSYKLPLRIVQRWKMENVRFFIGGTNLWIYTKYPGWDPEVLRNVNTNSQQGNISFAGPSYQTPQAKTIIAGIQIEF